LGLKNSCQIKPGIGRHDIAEILLKVALNIINQIKSIKSFITQKNCMKYWNSSIMDLLIVDNDNERGSCLCYF
jgi:hypothetical protein